MSHNVKYADYEENVNKKKVQAEWDHYVAMEDWQEGATGLCDPIRWNDYVCENLEEAEKWIKTHDSGWYDQLAVKYKAPAIVKDSVKKKELSKKVMDAHELYLKRSEELYPKTRTSEYIGCGKCGSKLASRHLTSNHCPVCHADLRPETTLKSIATAKTKWEKALQDEKDWINSHAKTQIRWLVKIEYHT